MAKVSMYWINTDTEIARMAANFDVFLATAKDFETLKFFAKPMKQASLPPLPSLANNNKNTNAK